VWDPSEETATHHFVNTSFYVKINERNKTPKQCTYFLHPDNEKSLKRFLNNTVRNLQNRATEIVLLYRKQPVSTRGCSFY
jgi:hypothetical protein